MSRAAWVGLLGAAITGAAALSACGGDLPQFPAGSTTTASSSSGSSSGGGGAPLEPPRAWTECQASDQAWVRRAVLALDGRRTWGQAEVNALEDAIKALRAADPEAAATPTAGGDMETPKRLVARALMRESAFRERWSDFLLEALRINRIEGKSQESCYGPPNPNAIDDGSIAAYVRDNDSSSSAPPLHDFTMGQLLSSAIELDDLSVVYRANLFAMMHLPIGGANVGPEAMERIRRQNFGAVFSTTYIHRDLVCLDCHNSEYAVTYSPDPAHNRHWPVPGLFEAALYGSSDGRHPPEEAAEKGPDDLRAYSVFRYADVVTDAGGQRPWGWAATCGRFQEPAIDDPLGIDAFFGSVRSTPAAPKRGVRASVWDLERALRRGVDRLAAHGLTRGADDTLEDADEALAYVVAENIVEKVWEEVMGHRLTLANYFPRTRIQRDVLMSLTERFVATHFSLKALLLDIVAHPAFNLKAPEEGCGAAPYELPNLFDPWTVVEADPGKRGNSPADAIHAISSRPLARSLHKAMRWPTVVEYPHSEDQEAFEVAIGFFIKDGDPGFRGLDFQGRLTWESAYGACADLTFGSDFVAQIVEAAQAESGATLESAILALKDRLVGEPSIDVAERAELEALVGPLSAVGAAGLDQKLRAVCGVLVSSPQFMLGGIAPRDTREVPALTPAEISYDGTCAALSEALWSQGAGFSLTCGGGAITATAP